MAQGKVVIVMGSTSDLPAFEEAEGLLKQFGVGYDIKVMSAHRSPKLVVDYFENLPSNVHVVVAAAGGAAHLAGVVSAHTLRPVIGVPMDSKLKGVDSFVSTSQMPAGIPVATMSIGKAGATNAILLAIQILALHHPKLERKLVQYRKSLVKKIREANRTLKATR